MTAINTTAATATHKQNNGCDCTFKFAGQFQKWCPKCLSLYVQGNTKIPLFFRKGAPWGKVDFKDETTLEWTCSAMGEYLLFTVTPMWQGDEAYSFECEMLYDGSWEWRDVPEYYQEFVREFVGQF